MNKGLTLIETVISIAIISIGVLIAITSFPLGIRVADINQKKNTALFLASAQIETLIHQGYEEAEEGVFVEDFGEVDAFEEYKRETEVTCFQPEGVCILGMKKVKVTVYFQESEKSSVSLTAIINE